MDIESFEKKITLLERKLEWRQQEDRTRRLEIDGLRDRIIELEYNVEISVRATEEINALKSRNQELRDENKRSRDWKRHETTSKRFNDEHIQESTKLNQQIGFERDTTRSTPQLRSDQYSSTLDPRYLSQRNDPIFDFTSIQDNALGRHTSEYKTKKPQQAKDFGVVNLPDKLLSNNAARNQLAVEDAAAVDVHHIPHLPGPGDSTKFHKPETSKHYGKATSPNPQALPLARREGVLEGKYRFPQLGSPYRTVNSWQATREADSPFKSAVENLNTGFDQQNITAEPQKPMVRSPSTMFDRPQYTSSLTQAKPRHNVNIEMRPPNDEDWAAEQFALIDAEERAAKQAGLESVSGGNPAVSKTEARFGDKRTVLDCTLPSSKRQKTVGNNKD